MIKLTQKIAAKIPPVPVTVTLSLPVDVRVRSRARVTLDDGREAGLFMPRGHLLRGGDILKSEDGLYVKIIAAPEMVSTAIAHDEFTLIKAAYHLGNRHVPLQIEKYYLRYRHDHILDDMLRQMGLMVHVSQKPFEPEAGAYQQVEHQQAEHHQAGHTDDSPINETLQYETSSAKADGHLHHDHDHDHKHKHGHDADHSHNKSHSHNVYRHHGHNH